MRWFEGQITMLRYEANGNDIKSEQTIIKLNYNKNYITTTLPLITRFRRTLKKRQQDATATIGTRRDILDL